MTARIIRVAGLVVLAAALSAPLASAMRDGRAGAGTATSSYANARSTAINPTYDVGGVLQQAHATPTVNATYDVGGVLRQAHATPTPTAVAASATGDGFDWGSAGIGAAALAAFALAGALLVVRGRHAGAAVS